MKTQIGPATFETLDEKRQHFFIDRGDVRWGIWLAPLCSGGVVVEARCETLSALLEVGQWVTDLRHAGDLSHEQEAELRVWMLELGEEFQRNRAANLLSMGVELPAWKDWWTKCSRKERVAALYEWNLEMYPDLPRPEARRLRGLISRDLERITNTPEHSAHRRLDAAGTWDVPEADRPANIDERWREIDPEIVELVQVLNQIPGVTTRMSCQGSHRGFDHSDWAYGPIFFVSSGHRSGAYIEFSDLPIEVERELSQLTEEGVASWSWSYDGFRRLYAGQPERSPEFIAKSLDVAVRIRDLSPRPEPPTFELER